MEGKDVREMDLVQCWNMLNQQYQERLDNGNNKEADEILSQMSNIDTQLYNEFGYEMF